MQWGIVFGSFGWFTMLFMIFCKIFPSVSMYEVKEMVYHRSQATKKLEATGKIGRSREGSTLNEQTSFTRVIQQF